AVETFVVDETDVEPVTEAGDTASIRVTFGAANGCERLEQRVIRYAPGRSQERTLTGCQEVMFVVAGAGELHLAGERHSLAPDTGVFIAPEETYAVENPGPGELLAVSVLAPEDRADVAGARKVTVRFEDQPELPASSERTFRYLVNEDAGCF